MDGRGEIVAHAAEVADAFTLLEQWKRTYKLRLGPSFLLIPGYKIYALERLLATEDWVKARLSAATRVTGVRQLSEDGTKGPCTVFELKGKQHRWITIGKLNGTSRKLELPLESKDSYADQRPNDCEANRNVNFAQKSPSAKRPF